MVRRKCCIPDCHTTDDAKKCSVGTSALFEFPKQPMILVVWLETLSQLGVKVEPGTLVCERHFYPDEVKKENERSRLKPTAVPSLRLKAPSRHKRQKKLSVSHDEENRSFSLDEDISFDDLRRNLHLIVKPSDWWSVSSSDDEIVCAKWNKDLVLVKRVIIGRDFRAKVFVNQLQINITDGLLFRCLKTISTLLKIVEDLYL